MSDLLSAVFTVPASARNSYIGQWIIGVGKLLNDGIILLMGIAVIVFFWGLFKFMLKGGDKGANEEGRNQMLWGIIALFVMVATWGLVNLLEVMVGVQQHVPTGSTTINSQSNTSGDLPDFDPGCDGSSENPC